MAYYTDIASEIYEKHKKDIPQGVQIENFAHGCVDITRVNITRVGLNRARGQYITLDMPLLQYGADKSEEHIIALAQQLSTILPQSGAILVVGVGNAKITADALGPVTVERVLASAGANAQLCARKVYAIATGVEGASGIKTVEYIKAIISIAQPKAVICIDSLLTRCAARLGTSVQLSTSGLAPKSVRELSQKTLGVPVIAVGVPTIIQIKNGEKEGLAVTPKNIDFIIRCGSGLLAAAINKALYPSLSVSDIDFITF